MHEVVPFDAPVRRAFALKNHRTQNCLETRSDIDADLFILSGPILKAWWQDYSSFVEKLHRQGKSYALVSLSACDPLDHDERKRLIEFFGRFPPRFISTRDEATHHYLRDLKCPLLNGICTAWFAHQHIPFAPLRDRPHYITSSFHRLKEPTFQIANNWTPTTIADSVQFVPRGKETRWGRIADSFRTFSKAIDTVEIVRPQHGTGLHLKRLQFPLANSYSSLTPSGFLSLYAASKLTITDRVHAAVISISLGTPTRLLYDGFRSGLVEKVGIDYANGKLIKQFDLAVVDQMKQELRDFVVEHLQ